MTKSRIKCIAITIVFIFVTLSSAHEGLKICRRIKSNSLKLSAMGPLGATDFVLLTTEGHLFIVPRSNLLNVGQANTNLYLDRVPINPERVFRVQLNYTQQAYRHFFIVHRTKAKIPVLMMAQGDPIRRKTIFRAYYFEWNRNGEYARNSLWWDSGLFDVEFMMSGLMDICADAYLDYRYKTGPRHTEHYVVADLGVCLEDNGVYIEEKDKNWTEYTRFGPFAARMPIQTGFELPLNGIFHRYALLDSGEIYYTQINSPNPRRLCHLKDFIQCGPGFRDETDRWEEPKPVDPENPNRVVSTEATQPNDAQPSNIIWILLAVAVLALIASLYCWLSKKKKKNRIPKNRGNAGSSAKDTSPNNVSSPNSSTGTGPTSSKATSSQASKPKKKKVTSGQVKSVKDRIWSILKGGRKKAAKSRANASKVNKSKANMSSRS